MYGHKDQDSTSALTPSLPSHQSRAAAFARESRTVRVRGSQIEVDRVQP